LFKEEKLTHLFLRCPFAKKKMLATDRIISTLKVDTTKRAISHIKR
jgi:hypothetical protein